MRPFLVLVRHDLRVSLRSLRLRVVLLVTLALCTIAVVSGTYRYSKDVRDRETFLETAEQEWLHQEAKAPHPANHFGRWVVKPLEPLSVFDRGVEDFVGQRLVVDAHVKTPLVGSVGEEDPMVALLGGFDLSFVVSVLVPLLVIFVVHDAISGEKERGTLRQVLAAPVSRPTLLLAKFAAHALLGAFAFILPVVVAFALPALLGVRFSPSDLGSMTLMVGAVALYVAFFLFCSLAVSASTAGSKASLGWLLVLWLSLVFLVPRAAEIVAASVHPAPPPLSLHRAQASISKNLAAHRLERYQEVLAEVRKSHPEIPPEYGTQGHDRTVRPDASWQADPTGVFIPEANAMVNRERNALIDSAAESGHRQEALAQRLSAVSPAVLTLRALSATAGTDAAHHHWFEAAVNRYFEEFGAYFNGLWAKNVQVLSDFSSAPRFTYPHEPASTLRGRAVPAILLLAAFALGAALWAAFRVARCDAR